MSFPKSNIQETTIMQKFKAFRIDLVNGLIRSDFVDISFDELSPGNVLIKTVYSSINYKDALAATGKGAILKKYPLVGGIDVAGVVESSSDKRFRAGDQVLICGSELSETRDGGYAEYVRAPADIVIPIATGMTMFQAMAIGTAGFTAALAIQKMQEIGQTPEQGEMVVTGATGGVGSFAIDILSGLRYQVVAISSKAERIDYLKALGADRVLLREQLLMGEKPLEKGLWGGAIDNVGGDLLAWLTRTVKPMGNIAAIGLTGGTDLHTSVITVYFTWHHLAGY